MDAIFGLAPHGDVAADPTTNCFAGRAGPVKL